jgi:two-component system, cell cycle response regulator
MIDDEDDDEKTSLHQVVNLQVPQNRTQSPCVIVVSGKSQGKMFKVNGDMTIGRTVNADVYLDDDGVSRKHARIEVRPDGAVQVVDLGSTNGTYSNGERIDVRLLRDGDKIQIGTAIILKFSYQDAIDEALQTNLYESATRDGLTRLYNKKHFHDVLKKEFAYAMRNKVALSLVMFDVDHFKKINDTHGHPAGDYVLGRLAVRVAECIRTEDTLARYGGEEFALVLREIPEDKAIVCGERIRRTVETGDFTYKGTRIPVTVSLGIATFTGQNYQSADLLIESADKYLYRAKQSGRNRVESKMLASG